MSRFLPTCIDLRSLVRQIQDTFSSFFWVRHLWLLLPFCRCIWLCFPAELEPWEPFHARWVQRTSRQVNYCQLWEFGLKEDGKDGKWKPRGFLVMNLSIADVGTKTTSVGDLIDRVDMIGSWEGVSSEDCNSSVKPPYKRPRFLFCVVRCCQNFYSRFLIVFLPSSL